MTRDHETHRTFTEENLPAMYVSNPKNVRYLCGFTGEDSALLFTENAVFFLTDKRYVEQARGELNNPIQIVCWTR